MMTVELLTQNNPSSLFKMLFFTRIWYWGQSYYYNSLLHFFSLFIEEMRTIFTWGTGFSFSWLPFLYHSWSSLMYKKHFYISSVEFWTYFLYCPDFFIIFLLLLGTMSQDFSRSSYGGLLQWTLDESCEPHLEAVSHQSKSFVEDHYYAEAIILQELTPYLAVFLSPQSIRWKGWMTASVWSLQSSF